ELLLLDVGDPAVEVEPLDPIALLLQQGAEGLGLAPRVASVRVPRGQDLRRSAARRRALHQALQHRERLAARVPGIERSNGGVERVALPLQAVEVELRQADFDLRLLLTRRQ